MEKKKRFEDVNQESSGSQESQRSAGLRWFKKFLASNNYELEWESITS
jgi:hypothetical protein